MGLNFATICDGSLQNMQTQKVLDEFRNEPFTDFSKPENADAITAAIEKVRLELGREYPIIDQWRKDHARFEIQEH